VPSPAGILWGAKAIGAEIGKGPRQVFYLLESGKLPAQRVGRQWVTTKSAIRAWLAGDTDTNSEPVHGDLGHGRGLSA
jgi:hypothetical protein